MTGWSRGQLHGETHDYPSNNLVVTAIKDWYRNHDFYSSVLWLVCLTLQYYTGFYNTVWTQSFFQLSSDHSWTSVILLNVHRLYGVIEGRLSHFMPHWLRTGWQSVIGQGEIPWNTTSWLGIEPGSRRGQTVRYIPSPTELSWLLNTHYYFTC